MSTRRTRQDHVIQMREHAVMLAKGILSGDRPVLDACLWLDALRRDVEVEADDPDFLVFAAISSRIAALPIEGPGQFRTAQAPAETGPETKQEIQSATAWATPLAITACESLVRRFEA